MALSHTGLLPIGQRNSQSSLGTVKQEWVFFPQSHGNGQGYIISLRKQSEHCKGTIKVRIDVKCCHNVLHLQYMASSNENIFEWNIHLIHYHIQRYVHR